MKKIFVTLLLLTVVGGPALLWLISKPTRLEFETPVTVIGNETPVRLRATNPHGIRRITAWLEQDGARAVVFESVQPATRFWFWKKSEAPRNISFAAGKKVVPELRDGKARLVIEVQGNDFRGQTASLAQEVLVNTQPLKMAADGAQHYINQGGSELVTFTVSGYWTEAGVRVGPYTFRSFPFPGKSSDGASERFSLFAFPWDVPASTVPVVYASNPAGEKAEVRFWFKVFPKSFRKRNLDVSDSFLEKAVNELDPSGAGDMVSRFLRVNGEMRRRDNQALADLRNKTEERFLWAGPFLQLANSKVESQFADTRSYFYQGKKIDEQTHLGFDLAVTRNVEVLAANDGKVVWADRLGIYGNCVVIDHGYGLQSIYGHLSRISVHPGDTVKKGQAIGNSGDTGLAGGDHLHFSMQVDGVQVNPVEWWDEHWIRDRILSRAPGS